MIAGIAAGRAFALQVFVEILAGLLQTVDDGVGKDFDAANELAACLLAMLLEAGREQGVNGLEGFFGGALIWCFRNSLIGLFLPALWVSSGCWSLV